MNECIGTPAELCALPYVEGTLPENELERFEEHYFDCPVCLERVQAIQAMGQAMAHRPIALTKTNDRPPSKVIAWPRHAWALAAAAVLLLVAGVVAYRVFEAQQTVAHTVPAPAPAAAPEPDSKGPHAAAQLADLALPAFVAPTLRGASEDAHFQAGMTAYRQGRCNAATARLAGVPAQDETALAARFYTGVCQMHVGNLAAASATLRGVTAQGDSPQQESALYYLAQIALARNDATSAHHLLLHAISLKGDLEGRARAEDRKVVALSTKNDKSGAGEPRNKSK